MRPFISPILLAATLVPLLTAASGAGALVHDRLPEPAPPATSALPWDAGTFPSPTPTRPDTRAVPVDAEWRESGDAEPGR